MTWQPALGESTLSRRQALALVTGVLLVHLWLLTGAPSWWTPQNDAPLSTPTLLTRQITLPPPPAARPAPAPTRPVAAAPPAAAPANTPPPAPRGLDDLASELTAPVTLPSRVASGVDLPPFNRSTATEPGVVEPTAFKAPGSALLKYSVQGKVKQFNYFASGELLWKNEGERYDARLEISAFLLGSRVQTSSGALGNEGLMPTRFGDKNRSELAAHFQRDKGLISFSANTPDVPLLKGAQDRLSIVLQLSALLAADPERFPVGTMLSFQTVSQREAEVWQFVVEKPETIELPFGNLATLKLNRKPRREFDQQIEIWFAPELGYLPARLRITNANGDQVDQLLRSLERPESDK
jgi:hypothetical protein